jgi:hypothetical protein
MDREKSSGAEGLPRLRSGFRLRIPTPARENCAYRGPRACGSKEFDFFEWLKAGSEMMYLERLTSVAEADFFNSNTAGMNACSTHLQDTATLELLWRHE